MQPFYLMRELPGWLDACRAALLFVLVGLRGCLATATTAAPVGALCAIKKCGDSSPTLLIEREDQSAEELRRTIEESVLNRLASSIREHVDKVESGERRPRPFVTLTYAQSIDGSIAAADKSQVCLSGRESRTMTHGLRSIHDAILVGAGTVRQDDPRLNIRHWPPGRQRPDMGDACDRSCCDGARREEAAPVAAPPRPVILAGSLSELPRCMRLGGAVIFTNLCSPDAWRWLAEWASRSREGSEDRAANDFVIAHCRLRDDGRCDIGDCLEKLYSMGFKSLMVEGGATVISSFLRGNGDEPHAESGMRKKDGLLVDRVVVTIAPVFLQGYNVLATKASDGDESSTHDTGFPLPLLDVGYVRLGQDLIVVGAPARGDGSL